MANDATAYSITSDLVDSYASMVDINTAIKSRYQLRLERILAEYKKRYINPDDYEFKISIVNGQAVYTLIERRKQIVKTTIRDRILKIPERKQYTKSPTIMLGNPLLQPLPTGYNTPPRDIITNPRSRNDILCEPSTTGSRRRSSSAIYRLHFAEASESDLTFTALVNSRCGSPVANLSHIDPPSNMHLTEEEEKHLDIPCVNLLSYQSVATPYSNTHYTYVSPLTTECGSISEDIEGLVGISHHASQLPAAKSMLSNGLNKQIAYPYLSAITIYKERQRQFRAYDNDRSVSCHSRRTTASLSKVFPQAIFSTSPPCNSLVNRLPREHAKVSGLRVLPICNPVKKSVIAPVLVFEPGKNQPSASSP